MSAKGKEPKKPGPKPDRLSIEGDWKDALRKAISVERPEGGWPKEGESDVGSSDMADSEDR